jgi:hypothetical protein
MTKQDGGAVIRRRGTGLQVQVYAGRDPLTGRGGPRHRQLDATGDRSQRPRLLHRRRQGRGAAGDHGLQGRRLRAGEQRRLTNRPPAERAGPPSRSGRRRGGPGTWPAAWSTTRFGRGPRGPAPGGRGHRRRRPARPADPASPGTPCRLRRRQRCRGRALTPASPSAPSGPTSASAIGCAGLAVEPVTVKNSLAQQSQSRAQAGAGTAQMLAG